MSRPVSPPPLGRRRRRLRRFLLAACLFLCAATLLCLTLDRLFPPPSLTDAPDPAGGFAQVILAADGGLIRAFPDERHIWRYPVRPEEVSPLYLEALIAFEDRYFYRHPGVNPIACLRAARQWLFNRRIVSGGSTLTMQVARLAENHARTRSVSGKLRQMVRALQLERRHSKREILTYYLNHAPMGGMLEGVEAASRGYFGKSARDLGHAEAALLAVLPQSPSRLRPDRFPARAQAARDKVLSRLEGVWDARVLREARQEPVYALNLTPPLLAPLLAERLHREHPGRSLVRTTLDAHMQALVEGLLLDRIRQLPPRASAAALVMDHRDGAVLAYAGSADFTDPRRFSHVDMVLGRRSPGSTLKPFLYGMALDEGLIHSESLLSDVPRSFGGYSPGNFQQSFSGPVSAAEALTRSLNVPAVEILDRLGPERFAAGLRQGGLRLFLPQGARPNLSLILGGAATTLEELVGAYAALARDGLSIRPRYTDEDPVRERRLLSAGAAFIIRDILESGGAVDRRLGGRAGARRGVAWKTGTSFGFRDAWSVGVSDALCVGVWVGRPDGTPNPGFFGANVAAPLLLDLFHALDANPPRPRTPPPTVGRAEICWPLGLPAQGPEDPACLERRSAWILNNAAPPTFPDPLYEGRLRFSYHTDAAGTWRLGPGCAEEGMVLVRGLRWPALLEPWLSPERRRRAAPPPWKPGCGPGAAARAGQGLVIAGLEDGAVIRRPPGEPAPLVELRARGATGRVFWLLDGRLEATLAAGEAWRRGLDQPGRHSLTAVDEGGAYHRISVLVE